MIIPPLDFILFRKGPPLRPLFVYPYVALFPGALVATLIHCRRLPTFTSGETSIPNPLRVVRAGQAAAKREGGIHGQPYSERKREKKVYVTGMRKRDREKGRKL